MWLGEALGYVLRLFNIEAAGGFALQEEIHRCEIGGADGVVARSLKKTEENR